MEPLTNLELQNYVIEEVFVPAMVCTYITMLACALVGLWMDW